MNIITTEVNAVEAPSVPATQVEVEKPSTEHSAVLDNQAVESTEEAKASSTEDLDALDLDEGDDDTLIDDEDESNEAEPGKKRKNGFEKALARMKRKQTWLEQELLNERNAKAGIPAQRRVQDMQMPAPVEVQAAPKLEDFEDYTTYIEALTTHKARELIRGEFESREKQHQTNSVVETYKQRLVETQSRIPDLLEAIQAVPQDIPAPDEGVREYVMESAVGPEIAYYLATNTKVLRNLASLTPMKQAIEIGKIEAQILGKAQVKAPEKKTTKAPAPVTSLDGGAAPKLVTSADIANDYNAWKASREASLKAKGRR